MGNKYYSEYLEPTFTMKGIAKTNVARLLDAAHIAYELVPYEVDEADLGLEVDY